MNNSLTALAEQLSDYSPCLNAGVCICDRRVVDEVISALREIAAKEGNPCPTPPA